MKKKILNGIICGLSVLTVIIGVAAIAYISILLRSQNIAEDTGICTEQISISNIFAGTSSEREAFRTFADEFISQYADETSEFVKVYAVARWVEKNIAYPTDDRRIKSAIVAYSVGTADCVGQADICYQLLTGMGFDCDMLYFKSTIGGVDHCALRIIIEGESYILDTTPTDTTPYDDFTLVGEQLYKDCIYQEYGLVLASEIND